jgi:uncharacterized protein YecE (DUF72 family)
MCSYGHWQVEGSFYGAIPAAHMFEVYATEFNTVELNASFYRDFPEATWVGWRNK